VSRRWSEIDADPNAPAVLAARRGLLDRTRRRPIDRREPYLVDLACGKRVLDVGVVEHRLESRHRRRWLHGLLVEAAASCTGVDVLEPEVAALVAEGYDVRVCDLTRDRLDDTFELVVIGEVIEHVTDPGGLLANAAAMLEPGGRLVFTTPNPYALHRAWRGLRNRPAESADHVLLLAPTHVAELAERCGLEVAAWRGVRVRPMESPRGKVQAAVRAIATRVLSPEVGCESIVYELVPASR